jgi:hypothetical protein
MTTPRPPGWYDDPDDSNAQRYWNGQEWTPQRQRKPTSRQTHATPSEGSRDELDRGGRGGVDVTEDARDDRERQLWKGLALLLGILLLLCIAYIVNLTRKLDECDRPQRGATSTTPTPAQGEVVPPPTTGIAAPDIDGTYLVHPFNWMCDNRPSDVTVTVTHQGNTLSISAASEGGGTFTGTLNADKSFSVAFGDATQQGVFTVEGGKTVMRGVQRFAGCTGDFVGTKQ